jgi:hypothetical protein
MFLYCSAMRLVLSIANAIAIATANAIAIANALEA